MVISAIVRSQVWAKERTVQQNAAQDLFDVDNNLQQVIRVLAVGH